MLETLYKNTIQVLRNTVNTDGAGGYTETEVVQSTITGLIVPVRGRVDFKYDAPEYVAQTHRCYCATTADILVSDKLKSGGVYYQVLYIEESIMGSDNSHKEIALKIIN